MVRGWAPVILAPCTGNAEQKEVAQLPGDRQPPGPSSLCWSPARVAPYFFSTAIANTVQSQAL